MPAKIINLLKLTAILLSILVFFSGTPDVKTGAGADNTSTGSVQRPEMVVQMGHSWNINSVSFSPDGKYLVSGSGDKTLKLWDVSSGKEIRTFNGHADNVTSVSFSPDGKFIVSGSWDKTLKLWDVSSGKEIRTFNGHADNVTSVSFSPNGKFIVSSSYDAIKLWDINNSKEIRTISGHSSYVHSVSFSPDGKYIVSGSRDETIKLWDVNSGIEIKTFKGHSWDINSVSFSPDGKYLVSGSRDETIKLWDVSSGKETKSFKGHSDEVTSVSFSPDGKYLVSGSGDKTLKLWDVSSCKEIKSFKGHSDEVASVSFSPDGKYLVSGSDDNYLKLWDVSSGKEIKSFSGHSRDINSVSFSPDGKYLVSGSGDKTLKLWNVNSGIEIRTFKGHSDLVTSVSFSLDGKYLVSGSWDKTLKLWDVSSGKEIKSFKGHSDEVASVSFSPDGRYLVSGSRDETIKLWDVSSGKEIRTFKGHSDVTSVSFSPDGKYIVSGSDDKILKLWDASSGKEIKSFSGHSWVITSVSFSPDGKYLVSGSGDKTLKLWDVRNGKEIRTFAGHSSHVRSVSFSPDGKYLVSGSDDSTIRLWNIATGEWTAFMANLDGRWLIFTNDGYWDSSPNGGDLVASVQGMDVWNIDQFAVRNNRPDKIISRLPNHDPKLVEHYYYQWVKRVVKSGYLPPTIDDKQYGSLKFKDDKTKAVFNKCYLLKGIIYEFNKNSSFLEQIDLFTIEGYEALVNGFLGSDQHEPTAEIKDAKQDDKFVNLNINLNDSLYNLKSYNVYVNDVPLFGAYGKNISGKAQIISEKIELTEGDNKIEVSCFNEKGAESFRALSFQKYDKPVKKNLYYIGFGVSKYKDDSLNLDFADKDANDLADVYKKLEGKGFDKVFTSVFINEQATRENIIKAKQMLKNAKPDDTLVLFISGHGMHDNDKLATYYYLTHETNLNKLSSTAANFELIEDILQGIPPRNKLFLMDTCEAGEIDSDTENKSFAMAEGGKGVKARTVKALKENKNSNITDTKKTIRSYLFDKDRYIYNDLARRSGAVVFSSCKGGEYSFERDDLQNGYFTYSIKNAFYKKESDADNNGVISIDELKNYVSKEVIKLSSDKKNPDGLQHPTVDRDNIYQKFGFVVK